jgi:predicted Zn-dependent protease
MTAVMRPIKARRATPATRVAAFVTAAALLVSAWPAQAQAPNKGLPIIRDAEIEQLLREYMTPILRAAGLAKQNIQVVIINDRSFNAFVADGRRIFVNAGAVMESETPNQIIGVLAHEAGHIAGGHLARLREQLAAAQTQMIIAMMLGVGAVVAGARTGSQDIGQVGAAAIAAPQAMIQRSLLAYQRSQEEQADRSAVKYLAATNQSARGMAETFKRLADQVLYNIRYIDPYIQSHPMPADRVAALQTLAQNSPHWDKKDSPEVQLKHDLARAKLFGFLERPDAVGRRYRVGDNSLPAQYARAIATYRFGNPRGAIASIDGLIRAQPNNPYFHELKGQALLEGGRPAEAIAPLRRAAQLAPNPTLIQVMLGQALVATNERRNLEEAVRILSAVIIRDREIPDAYVQIAMAYGRTGDLGNADLASAQAALLRGDVKTGRELAARAKLRFPVGSPGWVKADDIVRVKPPTPGRPQ